MRHNTDLVLHLRWIYKLVGISLGIRLKHSADLGLLLHRLLRPPWRRKRRGSCGPSFGSSSSTKKRKLSNKANIGSRNKKFKNDDDYEVWKIKKVLEKSNIGTMRRLILRREMEEEFVLSVLGDDADQIDSGVSVQIWDVDTKSILSCFQEMGFFKKLCIHWCDILFHSERFDIYIAYFRKWAPTGAEKREELEPEKRHANRDRVLAFKKSNFSLLVAGYEVTSRGRGGPLFAPLKMGQVATPNFAHHFYSKLQKEAIFGVVKCTSMLWDFEFQEFAESMLNLTCLITLVEMMGRVNLGLNVRMVVIKCLCIVGYGKEWYLEICRGSQETLGTSGGVLLPKTKLDQSRPNPGIVMESVQVIEVSSSEEDPEEDLEELSPEPVVDALDFPEDDEDPLPDVDSPEDIMSASEADSTEESGPEGTTNSEDSSS
ncbi:hypothetical protein D0Y65_026565 [Glycine soja]|uniref:Uncharacterized protein n=1 Tax=Glycine soja TaxID=3848 RepID=A0A445IKH9_GLYSO|nr:hypothetical protein D0Y65_026565 [Glycine soja]